jgi:hypothetical protein
LPVAGIEAYAHVFYPFFPLNGKEAGTQGLYSTT